MTERGLWCEQCGEDVVCGTGAPGDVFRCACPVPPESYAVL